MDGDGYLSMYELEYFYEEQMTRMEAIGIETLPFTDCLCQVSTDRIGIIEWNYSLDLCIMQTNGLI